EAEVLLEDRGWRNQRRVPEHVVPIAGCDLGMARERGVPVLMARRHEGERHRAGQHRRWLCRGCTRIGRRVRRPETPPGGAGASSPLGGGRAPFPRLLPSPTAL